MFLIIALGYLLGRIRIKGISLGISAVLIIALFFGHFGFTLPALIKNLGLACFATAVGYITGPVFLNNLKNKAVFFMIVGIAIVFSAAALSALFMKIFELPVSLALGIFSGAVTSTPGLAMALELTKEPLASVGYGVAYPFGVVGLVLTVQILSKISKDDDTESSVIIADRNNFEEKSFFYIDKQGMFFYSLALVIGILIGKISIPLGDSAAFGLGISGGALISGLFFGSLNHIGSVSTRVKRGFLDTMREFGLALFLAAAGVEAGSGFIATISEYGFILFVIGMIITLLPTLFGFVLAHKVFKIDMRSSLGAICGGMTSTPALGALSDLESYEKVTSGYAASYAVALLCVIIVVQFAYILFA